MEADRQIKKRRFDRVNDGLEAYYRRLVKLTEERDKEFSVWLEAQIEVLGRVAPKP